MENNGTAVHKAKNAVYILLVLFLFLFSIDLLTTALGYSGKTVAQSILDVTANPFVSLFIGLLITALIQSSSTTTSMIVAMVASGSIDMQRAIPLIMGANIGTTLTSTIVALTFITKREEFKRAIAAGSVHSFFNILSVAILFPLQLKFNFLGIISQRIAQFFTSSNGGEARALHAEFRLLNLPVSDWLMGMTNFPLIIAILGVILLFISIRLFIKLFYKIYIGSAREKFHTVVFSNPYKSFGWGVFITAVIHSSTVTTSLVVPMVATGKIDIRRVYPFIVGANIGTTFTALTAAVLGSPAAISIGITHFLFNVIGGFLFLLLPGFNKLPLIFAETLGDICFRHKLFSVLYIIITFFLLPFAFIYLTK